MGLRVRATPQGPYHNSYYFPSVAHFSLGNLIKLTLCFAGSKTTVRQPALCMPPVKRFRLASCLLVK